MRCCLSQRPNKLKATEHAEVQPTADKAVGCLMPRYAAGGPGPAAAGTAVAAPGTAAAAAAGVITPAVSDQRLLLVTQQIGGQFVKLLLYVQPTEADGSVAPGCEVWVNKAAALTGWVSPAATAAGARVPQTQQQVQSFLGSLTAADAQKLMLPPREVELGDYSVKQSCFCVLKTAEEYFGVTRGKQPTWFCRSN